MPGRGFGARARFPACVLLLTALGACSREPATQRLFRTANKYLEQGKFQEASIIFRRVIENNRRFGEAYFQLGKTELQLRRFPAAIAAFRRACELKASGADACSALGDLLLAGYLWDPAGNYALVSELEEISEGLIRRDARSFNGHRMRGYVLAAAGKDEEAEQSFLTADKIKPNQGAIVVVLARLLAKRDFEQAERRLLDLMAVDKRFGPAYDLLYVEYLKRNRRADADRMIELKVAQNPLNPVFMLQLASHYRESQRPAKMEEVLQRLATDRKKFPDGHLRAGEYYHAIGDFAAATREFRLGIEAQPESRADYQKRLVEALYSQGLVGDAVEMANRLVSENPNDPESKGMRAVLRMRLGTAEELPQAVADLADAVKNRPNSPGMRLRLGEGQMATGDFDGAAIQFAEASRLRPDLVAPRLGLTQALMAKGEFGKALTTCDAILKGLPDLVEARFQRAMALIGMGERQKGRAELDKLTQEYKGLPGPLDARARLDIADKRFRDAEAGFRALREIGPAEFHGLRGLVDTKIAEGKAGEAVKLAEAGLSRDPSSTLHRLLYADAARAAGQFETALGEYEYLQNRFPLDPRLHFQIGDAKRQTGRLHEAAFAFERACALSPNDVASHKRLAMVYSEMGNLAKARDAYQVAVRLAPDDVASLNNLAFILAELTENLDLALRYIERAKQRATGNPDIDDTMGWVYTRRNLTQEAIGIYEKLVPKHPNQALYRYHYATALFGKGDKAGARRELAAALGLKPTKEEDRKIRDLLAKLR